MHRNVLMGCAAFLLISATACGPSEEAEQAAREEARQQEFNELEQTRDALNAKREELAQKTAQLAEAAEEEVAQLEEEINSLKNAITADAEAFTASLIEFINTAGVAQDEELTGRPAAAMRMKSDEDILVAQEYIEVGGDYKKAIDIYDAALVYDPDYQRLLDLKAEAEALRFMTEERFKQVKKGMSPEEVQAALGTANPYNIQTYPDRNVEAWFYPKGTDGSAAGVYFEEKRGRKQVYRADFSAVKPTGEG